MVYGLVLFPLMVFGFFSMLMRDRSQTFNAISLLFVLLLIFLAGFRDGTGTDTATYASIWRNILPLDQVLIYGYTGRDYLEPGFRYLVSFLKLFTESSVVFFLVLASITMGFLYAGLKRIPQVNFFLALALYLMIFFIPYTLNAMRQAIAMSIFIFVLPYILNGNLKKTIFWSLLAASIHMVGSLILLAYFIGRLKIGLVKFIVIGLVFSVLFYILNIPERVIDLIASGKFSRFAENWGAVDPIQIILRFLILSVFVFAALYINKTKWFSKLVMIYAVGFFIYIGLIDASMMAARFNLFFRILEIVLFSVIVASARKLHNRFLFFGIATFLGLYIFYLNLLNEDNVYVSIF
jgi:hypothetical protein